MKRNLKLQSPDALTLKKILSSYSSLGKRVDLGDELKFYHCDQWKNSVMSPIILNQSKNWKKSLDNLELHFKNHSKKSPYDSSPYFNLIAKGKKSLPTETLKILRQHGWEPMAVKSSLNIWNHPLDLKLPRGIHIRTGSYFDAQLYPHFLKAMQKNFKASKEFMLHLNKMMKTIESNVTTVLLYSESGSCVGAGLVATKNNAAFLFCGSVNKPYRGRKLWKVLVAARQMISSSQGAKSWITTTRISQLLWQGEDTYRIHIFNKISDMN
jgi:hypothetical protein